MSRWRRHIEHIKAYRRATYDADAARNEKTLRWMRKNPEKLAAQKAARRAIADGLIERTPCVKCGNPKSDAHHDDYSKPLDVIFLCRQHHADRHRDMDDPTRDARIVELRRAGKIIRDIAAAVGLCGSRVHAILARQEAA